MITLCSSKRFILAAVAAVTVGFIASAPAHAQYLENFSSYSNGTQPSTFDQYPDPDWRVSNGTYGSYGDNIFSFSTLNASGYNNLSDFTLSVDILNAGDSGVVVRSDTLANKALTVILRANQFNYDFYFIDRNNNNWGSMYGSTSLSGTGIANDLSENLRMTVTGSGNTFTASVARISDPSSALKTISYTFGDGQVLSAGKVGVYQYNGNGVTSSFDNLSVTNNVSATAAPEPGTLALLAAGLPVGIVLRRRARAK